MRSSTNATSLSATSTWSRRRCRTWSSASTTPGSNTPPRCRRRRRPARRSIPRGAVMTGPSTPRTRRFRYPGHRRAHARVRPRGSTQMAGALWRNVGPPDSHMYAVMLSGSVIVLAYVAAAAVIIPAISMIGFGKVPKFLRRGQDPGKARTRMEGGGLLLIGAFIFADALAAGLIGLRYIAGRPDTTPQKPTA